DQQLVRDRAPQGDRGALRDGAQPPPRPARLVAQWGVAESRAGQENQVSCLVYDEVGEPIEGFMPTVELRPALGWRRAEEGEPAPEEGALIDGAARFIAERAGRYEATCVLSREGLRAEPAPWVVRPGEELYAEISLVPRETRAGTPVEVSCAYQDRWGNIADQPATEALTVTPATPGTSTEGGFIRFERAGLYQLSCDAPGVVESTQQSVEVSPDLAARLAMSLNPDAPFVSPGTVVSLEVLVSDRFSNPISGAPVLFRSNPPLPGFGVGRFLAESPGVYQLSATLSDETLEGRILRSQDELIVDEGAPVIRCVDPMPQEMLLLNEPTVLRGTVADSVEIEQVTVDGRPVPVDALGRFSTPVTAGWGLNVYSVNARDRFGQVSSTFCTLFAADRYWDEDRSVFDTVSLTLAPRAIDDGGVATPIRSFADILRSMLNSQGLTDVIDAGLRASNPIVPSRCYQRVPILGTCAVSATVTYRGLEVNGPNTISMTLINGGLQVDAQVRDLRLDTYIDITGPDLSGEVIVDTVDVHLLFDLRLRAGQPLFRLRNSDENSISLGSVRTDFEGFFGNIADQIFPLIESSVRAPIESELQGFLEGEVDTILSGVLSNLDLSAVSAALRLPSPSGGPPVELNLGVDFSILNSAVERLLITLKSEMGGTPRHARPSEGIPLFDGIARRELNLTGLQSMGAALSVSFLNQALHRLWRGGLFDLAEDSPLLEDLPGGLSLSFALTLPPVLTLEAGRRVNLHLGPAIGVLSYPALFPEPLTLRLAAFAHSTVSLEDGLLRFSAGEGAVEIDSLYLDLEGVTLSPQERGLLEQDFRRIIGAILGGALNDALPEIPLPEFALPNTLSTYGIRAGTRLGLRSPVLSSDETHIMIKGRFGQ
ncbi:MAG: hypothetical protein VYD19_09970, partial [Myxococcota bacterium]|nr:hypothetical protein [Myxococcota bacterium]